MEDSQTKYRTNLIESVRAIIAFERELFSNAINLLMSGELKEIDDVFEIDDVYEFNMNHLKLSNDINVKKLAKTIKRLRKTTEFLIKKNNITDNELAEE